MKNKTITIFFVFAFALYSRSAFVNRALAHTEANGETSATREVIEKTEENVLGSEKHTELEKVEPSIDASIGKYAPVVLGGVSLLMLAVAFYLKSKGKNNL